MSIDSRVTIKARANMIDELEICKAFVISLQQPQVTQQTHNELFDFLFYSLLLTDNQLQNYYLSLIDSAIAMKLCSLLKKIQLCA